MNQELRNKYEVVIGIECHVQLATKSKLFCGCDNDSREAEPNTNVCEVCLGLPGTLPVLNKRAVELALRLGKALNTEYPEKLPTKFDRKNYFYPDLPKGYQITQFDEPVVTGGYVEFPLDGAMKRVGITRAHLEEDAGKLTHPTGTTNSLVDLNRAGTPLLEIVSEPDMRSAAEAKGYAGELYNLVRYAEVSDANLYYGNMRFDVNVSVRLVGAKEFGTRTETKNLNSFRAIERAVEYETRRQIVLVEHGDKIRQETRGWDDSKQETYSMRSKEDADEYRYFPEPDLPPLVITRAMVQSAQKDMGVLPQELRAIMEGAKIPPRDIETVIGNLTISKIFLDTYNEKPQYAKIITNWLSNEVLRIFEEEGHHAIDNGSLIKLAAMLEQGEVSSTAAKTILRVIVTSEVVEGPKKIAQRLNLLQESNEDELGKVVDEVIAAHPQAVADYKAGNQRAFGSLVGACMKATQGKGNPPVINRLLKARLG